MSTSVAREDPAVSVPPSASLAAVAEAKTAHEERSSPVDLTEGRHPLTPVPPYGGVSGAQTQPEALSASVAPVRSPLERGAPANLLAPLGGAKRHLPGALFAARLANLAVMAALIYFGLGVLDDGVRYTNITSFLVWNIWWPFLVLGVFFAARAWCAVCHLRLTADIFDRFGLKLKVPKLLKKYGTTVPIVTGLGIFVVHSMVVSYDVHHFPAYTAIFLLGLMVYAAVVGLVFEKHSFCKYFCPLVGVLGNYTRVSPTELRSADLGQCKRCKDKSCLKNCQNRLYMGTMDDEQGESCLLCMRCVKHCPHDNIRFSPRAFFRGLWQSPKRTAAGTFALIVLLGIVMGEVGEEWTLVDGWLLSVPTALTGLFGFETVLPTSVAGGYLVWEAFWIFIVLPTLILAACGAVAWLLVRKGTPLEYMKIYALGFVPLVLSLHAAKLFSSFDDFILYLPGALTDPVGSATADAIAAGTLGAPGALVAPAALWGWLVVALVAGFGVFGSLYTTWRIAQVSFAGARADGVKTAIPFAAVIAALGTIAVITVYLWRVAGPGG